MNAGVGPRELLAKKRTRKWEDVVEHPVTGVLAPLVAVAIIVGAWQIAAQFTSHILISSPTRVARDLWRLAGEANIHSALATSLQELYIGLAIGVFAGITLGILVGRFHRLNLVLSPFINSLNAVPQVIAIPLFVIWIGIGAPARVLFIVLITFFPVLLNTAAGVRNVAVGYVELGRSFGIRRRKELTKIAIPGAAPYIFAGLRLGLSHAVVGMIIGEMEISNVGVGWLLLEFGSSYETGRLLALVIVTALIGTVNVAVLSGIERLRFGWIAHVR